MKPVVGRRIGSTRAAILLWIMLLGAAALCVEARLGPASTIPSAESHTQELEPSIPRFSTLRLLRRLQKLTGFGVEPDAADLPLPMCAGHCDNDLECQKGLICWRRRTGDRVPGCETNGNLKSTTDYCIDPSALRGDDDGQGNNRRTASPTTEPDRNLLDTAAPTFPGEMFLGNTPIGPPVANGASISDLLSNKWEMVFGGSAPPPSAAPQPQGSSINNANKNMPTATPTFEFRGPPVSVAPTSEAWVVFERNRFETLPLMYTGNDGDHDGPYPLLNCQGDCDDDNDCLGELVCFQREGGEPVPGCLDEDPGSSDYCVFPELLQDERAGATEESWHNGFMLKLHWEEGYTWQNETIERKWCITRNYTGSPITGGCWYGALSTSCNATELYVDRCNKEEPDPRQMFDFVPVSSDEVLIQAYGEDRCLSRLRRNITMQPCNATNPRQHWFAPGGGFNEPKFELSQNLLPKYCVSQDHHPKPGEVVRMFSCEEKRSRAENTSYWNLYSYEGANMLDISK